VRKVRKKNRKGPEGTGEEIRKKGKEEKGKGM
jgi:hypothetical protein